MQDIADAPQWLIERAGKAREKSAAATVPVVDAPSGPDRAIHYLLHEAPLSIKGQGGDNTAFKVAARVKDFGVTEQQALDLMLDHWNDRCPPGWSPEKLSVKIANAYRHGKNSPGSAAPEAVFKSVVNDPQPEPTTESTTTPPPAIVKRRLKVERFEDIDPDLTRPMMVHGCLNHGAESVLYAPPGSNKTNVAAHLAVHVAAEREWFGHRVSGGGVIYLAGEGHFTIRKRIKALRMHYGLENQSLPFVLVPSQIDLLNPKADTAEIIAISKDLQLATGKPTVLVVVDTLARAMAGGDENSAADMGRVITNIGRIRDETGAHVMVVHHSGKDASKGARGSSALLGAIDTELQIDNQTISTTKDRDGPQGRPMRFDVLSVTIGSDGDGNPVTASVVQPRDGAAGVFSPPAAGTVEADLLEIVGTLAQPGTPVPLNEVRQQLALKRGIRTRSAWTACARGVSELRRTGRIKQIGGTHVALPF